MGSNGPDESASQWEKLPMTTMRFSILASTMLLSLGLGMPAQAQQAPNMTFFVTSVGPGKGGDLGGLAGADAYCQSLAATAGAGGKTWRAYLSSNAAAQGGAVNARDRIGNGPWQNFKGEVIATSVADLHSANNKLTRETRSPRRAPWSTASACSRTSMTP